MKIIDVAEFYSERGGGVRTYIEQKLSAAARAGHEAIVVAPGPENSEIERCGGRVIWVHSYPIPFDPRYYLLIAETAVHRILDRESPDVVEGSSPWTGGWFVARWPGRALKSFVFHQDPIAVYPETLLDRYISQKRIDVMFEWYWAYLRRISARFHLTVTAGHWLAERLRQHGIRAPHAVPFGIDKQVFSPALASQSRRDELIARCGMAPDTPLLVAVGRHHPEKRLGTLIEAVRIASQTRALAFVLFGDGPLRAVIERRAARVKGVYVAGHVSDRQELASKLASADAMLHGSSAETFGLSVAEAVCSGLGLIVADRGGAADLAHPEFSETYTAGDARACARAILRFLSRDQRAIRDAAQRAAASHVLDMDAHFQRLFALYCEKLQASTHLVR